MFRFRIRPLVRIREHKHQADKADERHQLPEYLLNSSPTMERLLVCFSFLSRVVIIYPPYTILAIKSSSVSAAERVNVPLNFPFFMMRIRSPFRSIRISH